LHDPVEIFVMHDTSGTPHQAVFWLVKNVFGEVIVNFFIEEKCVHIIVYSIEGLQCICNISLG
jgi:hypothetical protein